MEERLGAAGGEMLFGRVSWGIFWWWQAIFLGEGEWGKLQRTEHVSGEGGGGKERDLGELGREILEKKLKKTEHFLEREAREAGGAAFAEWGGFSEGLGYQAGYGGEAWERSQEGYREKVENQSFEEDIRAFLRSKFEEKEAFRYDHLWFLMYILSSFMFLLF